MKIELDFNERDISMLYHTTTRSFQHEQPGRFLNYDETQKDSDLFTDQDAKSVFRFTENYLDALILRTYYHNKGTRACIINDEHSESLGWIVLAEDKELRKEFDDKKVAKKS